MRILYSNEIETESLTAREKLSLYNAFDVLLTREVFDVTHPMLDEITSVTYNFHLALQAPIMEMQLQGYLIDRVERNKKIKECIIKLKKLEEIINEYAQATWEKPLNAKSWQQKGAYLYDFAKCKEITKFDWSKGISRRTTERAAIEKLAEKYPKVQPVCLCILGIMDISKQLGTLKSGIDKDGYMRASFMIAGTVTGRLSSKKNIFGRASNFQNWAEHLRSIFTVREGAIPNREKYYIPKEYR